MGKTKHTHTKEKQKEKNENYKRWTWVYQGAYNTCDRWSLGSTCLNSSIITCWQVKKDTTFVQLITHTQFKVCACAWGGARERDKSFCLSLSISESLPPSPVFLISVCMEQQVDMFSFFSVFHITQSWTTIWTPIPVLWRVDIAVVDVGFASVNVISTMKVQVNEKTSRDVGMFPDIKHLTVAQWSGIF